MEYIKRTASKFMQIIIDLIIGIATYLILIEFTQIQDVLCAFIGIAVCAIFAEFYEVNRKQ